MNTTKDIIALIGSDRFQQMLDIGPKSISRAEAKNKFTASWLRAITEELADLGHPPPSYDLFNFKERIPVPEK